MSVTFVLLRQCRMLSWRYTKQPVIHFLKEEVSIQMDQSISKVLVTSRVKIIPASMVHAHILHLQGQILWAKKELLQPKWPQNCSG